MATKPLAGTDGTLSQAANRFLDTFTDQHVVRRFPEGRPWCGWREYSVQIRGRPRLDDGFIGGLQQGNHEDPLNSSWQAPWVPEEKYFEFDYRRSKIRIRYDRIIADDRREMIKRYEAANKIANQNNWRASEYGQPIFGPIMDILGPMPRSPELAEAAMAGDRWLLGDEGAEANPKLARLLGLSDIPEGIRTVTIVQSPPLATADEVLAMTPDRIAEIVMQVLDAREQQKKNERAAKMRAGKSPRSADAA